MKPDSQQADLTTLNNVDGLVANAQRRIATALAAWHSDDYDTVCVMAPIAVEMLGKAALWSLNPALLTPVGPDAERSLIKLVVTKDLSAPGIRTVGLSGVLTRLNELYVNFPIAVARRKNIANVRNGAVHVGARADEVLTVVQDCLEVISFLLNELGRDEHSFFGAELGTVKALANKHQESVSAAVQMKRARARSRLSHLKHTLAGSFSVYVKGREDDRVALSAEVAAPRKTGIDAVCPECASTGRLMGDLTLTEEVDFEMERVGESEWEPVIEPFWQAHLEPTDFLCVVCLLQLNGLEELRDVDLPTELLDVDAGDLNDPGITFEEYARYDED